MAKTRTIYQIQALYVGPTGARSCTGSHSAVGIYGNLLSATSGINLGSGFVAELYRIQNVNHGWNKSLQDVNQFGELAAIDRVSLEPPTVNLSYSWLQNNLINEKLIGLNVAKAGDASHVSFVSGILNATSDMKNYFLKIVGEGNDVADYDPSTYDVISFGNSYIASYTAQGSVGNFPTVDVTLTSLNQQAQTVTQAAGAIIPAVNQTDGAAITGWGYVLPTGLTSFGNASLTDAAGFGISVLRPGDITLALGLNAGDGFANESDMKIQSYNVSFNFNQEDINKLGTKYAYAKVPRFPVQATLTVSALLGDIQTGSLVQIVDDNRSFNPSVTIKKPGTTTTAVYYQLRNAKLDSQDFSSAIGSNATVNLTFNAQIAGPQDLTNGLVCSGITI